MISKLVFAVLKVGDFGTIIKSVKDTKQNWAVTTENMIRHMMALGIAVCSHPFLPSIAFFPVLAYYWHCWANSELERKTFPPDNDFLNYVIFFSQIYSPEVFVFVFVFCLDSCTSTAQSQRQKSVVLLAMKINLCKLIRLVRIKPAQSSQHS